MPIESETPRVSLMNDVSEVDGRQLSYERNFTETSESMDQRRAWKTQHTVTICETLQYTVKEKAGIITLYATKQLENDMKGRTLFSFITRPVGVTSQESLETFKLVASKGAFTNGTNSCIEGELEKLKIDFWIVDDIVVDGTILSTLQVQQHFPLNLNVE